MHTIESEACACFLKTTNLGNNIRKTGILLRSGFWPSIEMNSRCCIFFNKFRYNCIKIPLAGYIQY